MRDGEADVLIVGAQQLVWKSEPDAEVAAVVTPAVQRVRFGDAPPSSGSPPRGSARWSHPQRYSGAVLRTGARPRLRDIRNAARYG